MTLAKQGLTLVAIPLLCELLFGGALAIALLDVNILIAVALAHYFSKGTASRLRILMDNTYRFANGKELNPPTGGNVEISTLDRFFSEMASKIQQTREKEKELQKLKPHRQIIDRRPPEQKQDRFRSCNYSNNVGI